jgi:hypothetical protein
LISLVVQEKNEGTDSLGNPVLKLQREEGHFPYRRQGLGRAREYGLQTGAKASSQNE